VGTLLLSIDFEDWHQLVHRRLGRVDWNRPHPAFAPQVNAVLDLLDELDARPRRMVMRTCECTSRRARSSAATSSEAST